MTEIGIIKEAFPSEIQEEVDSLLEKFDIETKYSTHLGELVVLGKESIRIPNRVYFEEPYSLSESKYTQTEKEIINCIFSRHCNGFVRQKAIKNIINSGNNWTTPYIVRIIGEYIIEILDDINSDLELINKHNLISFIKQNHKFYIQTTSRVTSYWNCYYRRQFLEKIKGIKVIQEQRYIGFRLLGKIDELLTKEKVNARGR